MFCLFDDGRNDKTIELYDLATDPYQLHNLRKSSDDFDLDWKSFQVVNMKECKGSESCKGDSNENEIFFLF